MKDCKIILLLVLFATVLAFAKGVRIRAKYACEGHVARLNCRAGYEISIMRAMYGRTNRRTCRHPLMRSTNCRSSRSLSVVRRICQKRRSCAVAATNRNFGDPCFGTYKYLFILYFCRRRISHHSLTICEHGSRRLRCPRGRVMNILYANYGRLNRHTCPSRLIRTTNCRAKNSLSRVRASCQGRSTCILRASNSVFGDPCYGTYKYLHVSYKCYRPAHHSLTICEHRSRRLRCPRGHVMNILYANYGRLNRHTCPSRLIRTTNCRARNSLSRVRASCQGRSTCILRASNSVFGDPCYGTYKYLHVSYKCYRPVSTPSNVFICEGNHRNLVCPHGKSIHILYAMYGRRHPSICYRAWLTSNIFCSSYGALGIVRSKCQYRRTCSLFASNSVFGDPCYGTYKYLFVRYRCV